MATTLMRNTAPRINPGRYYLYLAGVIAAACVVVGISVVSVLTSSDIVGVVHPLLEPTPAMVACAVAGVLVEVNPLRWRGLRNTSVTLMFVPFVLALMTTWGFIPALIVQTLALTIIFVRTGSSPWRAVFNWGQTTLALSAAWWLWWSISQDPVWSGASIDIVALIISATVWSTLSFVLIATALWLRMGGSWWEKFAAWTRGEWALRSLLIVVVPVLAMSIQTSVWMIITASLPLFGLHFLLRVLLRREREAGQDPLTELLNRRGFQTECEQKLIDAKETDSAVALLVLDLDRFSEINNALGHNIGDAVLKTLADRFRLYQVEGKSIARHGGDEFAFAWSELEGMTDPMECARSIRASLDKPVMVGDLSVEMDGSVGIAVYPRDGEDFETLLQHANIALNEAKKRATTFARYTPEYEHPSPERLILLGDLRRTLETPHAPGVDLYYQPQVRIDTGEITGVEALLRYTHPTRGAIPPFELIAAAEHSSVMRSLTERVVAIALGQMKKWATAGHVLDMAINVSVRDLQSAEFTEYLAGQIDARGIDPTRLRLEITESALMDDPRRVVTNVERLARLGVKISLDDFGTGFSSMQHLRRLPVSEIKIDRVFVAGALTDSDDAAIVSSTIDLALAMDLTVVAEGVEDAQTREKLKEWGCHLAQGWYFGRPMNADQFDRWISDEKNHPLAGNSSVNTATDIGTSAGTATDTSKVVTP